MDDVGLDELRGKETRVNKEKLIAERARLILPKLIEYMEVKERKLTASAKEAQRSKSYDGGSGKMALTTYDDLIMTRAAVEAILTGKHEAGKMRILGLWEEGSQGAS